MEQGFCLNIYCTFPDQIGSIRILKMDFEKLEGTPFYRLHSYSTDEQAGRYEFLLIGDKSREKCLYDYEDLQSIEDFLQIYANRNQWGSAIIGAAAQPDIRIPAP